MGIETIIAIAAVAVSAVGAGLSYSAANDAADTQSNIAAINAQAQAHAIRQQEQAASLQAQINQTIASNEKAAMDRNAAVLEEQARVNTAAGAENLKRTRDDYARMLAAQRAQIGKSGVVDTTGSPLSILTATAAEEQRAADNVLFETENQRRSLFREADNQRAQGVAAEMGIFDAQARGAAAHQSASNQLAQSQIDMYSAQASAAGMRRQATANLISSAGQIMGTSYGYFQKTPRTAK